MTTTDRKPVSGTRRWVFGGVFVVAIAVIAVSLRAYPEFGPPIIFGFSLGIVGLVGGSLLAVAMFASHWLRRAGKPR